MDYAVVKLIHQAAVTLSILGFLARGLGMLADSDWVRHRAARTLPHIVDTILLFSGVTLAWQLELSPAAAPWMAAKFVGLVVYIGLGMVALRRGRTKGQRTVAWIAALVTFGYIVTVALTKDPLGFLVLLCSTS
jgi:uncharacterized membrane protein SirB2